MDHESSRRAQMTTSEEELIELATHRDVSVRTEVDSATENIEAIIATHGNLDHDMVADIRQHL